METKLPIPALPPGCHFDEAKARRVIAFIEMLKLSDGHFYGQPMRLMPWQKQIIWDVYGTLKEDGTRIVRNIWIELPKKNGKTGFGAGAANYHTYADGEMNGQIFSVAAEREQASILFEAASLMVQMNPALMKRSKITESTRRIRDKVSNSLHKVLSSEAYSKHGYKPSAVFFDEIHAQRDRKLYDVLTFGAGASRRQPIWWNMTTAGGDPDRVTIGWELHEYAEKVALGEIIDPTWYVKIYSYDGDDIFNEENWKLANPSLGITKSIDEVRTDAFAAQHSADKEQLFRWLHLNQWVTNKLTSWLPLDLFDQTVGGWDEDSLIGKDCFIGLDASTTTDLSAIAMVFPPQPGLPDWRVLWRAWIPADNMRDRIKNDHVPYDRWADAGWVFPTPGNTIDHWEILEYINSLRARYSILEIVADPAFAVMLNQALMRDGFTVIEVKGDYANMTDPINTTEMLLRSGEMSHERNDLARWTFGNTSLSVNGSGLKKPVKQTRGKGVIRTKRIDPMVALFLAMQRARFYQNQMDLNELILSEGWGM